MQKKSVEELHRIWNCRSNGEWTADALEVVREELLKRNEAVEGEIEAIRIEDTAVYQRVMRGSANPKKLEAISRYLKLAALIGAIIPVITDPLGLNLKENIASGGSRAVVGTIIYSIVILVLLTLSDTVFRPKQAEK